MYFFFDSWVTPLALAILLVSLGQSTPTPSPETIIPRENDNTTIIQEGSLSGLGSSRPEEPSHSVRRQDNSVPQDYADWPVWQQYRARLARNPRRDLSRHPKARWARQLPGYMLGVYTNQDTTEPTELIQLGSSLPTGGLDGPIYKSNRNPNSISENAKADTLVEFSTKYPYRSLTGWALQLRLSPKQELLGLLRDSPVYPARYMMLMLDPKENVEANPPRAALVLMDTGSSTLRSVSQSTKEWDRDPIYLIQEVLKGLKEIHSKGIWHGSLGLDSILVGGATAYKPAKPWISDFGTATDVPESTESWIGIPCFQAPEILLGSYLTKAVDVWAVAMLLVYLLTAARDETSACVLTRKLTPSSPQVGRLGSSVPLEKRGSFKDSLKDLFRSRKPRPPAPQQPQPQPQPQQIPNTREQEHQASGLSPDEVKEVIGTLSFPDYINFDKMQELLSRTLCWPHDRLSAGEFLAELEGFLLLEGRTGSYVPSNYKGTPYIIKNSGSSNAGSVRPDPPNTPTTQSNPGNSGRPRPMGGSYVPQNVNMPSSQ